MFIYATGDIHVGQSLKYGKTAENGLPAKILDQQQLLTDFVDAAISNNVDFVHLGGDYYPKHLRIDPTALRILTTQVLRLANHGIEVRMLLGNHDKARHEAMDSNVDYFSLFSIGKIKVIGDPSVELVTGKDGVNAVLMYLPHLIPSEMYKWQKHERETVTDIIDHVLEFLTKEATDLIITSGLSPDTPKILFGHFGVVEAGRGSESSMIANNNICIPVSLLDRPAINACILSHIHKFWTNSGTHTKTVMIGSMDRFDFGEANDKKVFGKIEVLKNTIHVKVTPSKARKFVCIKADIDNAMDFSFLDGVDINDAVVKINLSADKDFIKHKDAMDKIKNWLEQNKAYFVQDVSIIQKPVFVVKNAAITESQDLDVNIKQILEDEGFAGVSELMKLHLELRKEIEEKTAE